MSRKFHWLPIIFIGGLLIAILYGDWLRSFNSKVIEPYGDGFKAYHAILYHARYDSTYNWYEGMNYPYGEHIVPGASQPLVSNSMRVAESMGIPASKYGWGIVHGSILLGMLLAFIFTYLLLCRLGQRFTVCLIGAVFITLMAPQINRIGAHYGLAHLEVLPMVLYFLRRWEERPGWGRSLAVAACVTAFSLIHFYYFAILAFTIGGFLGAYWLISREWRKWWFYALHLGLMFVLPAIGFFSWFAITDPTSGRNESPFGFSLYQAKPLTVFASHQQPFWKAILPYKNVPEYEGWAYVGLVAGLLFFGLLGRWLWKQTKVAFVPAVANNQRFLNALLLAGSGLLLFSFGLPIDQLGGDRFLEYTGPLRQFRSIGRFAWLFYYAATLTAVVVLATPESMRQLFPGMQARRRQLVQRTLLVLAILIATSEVFLFQQATDRKLQALPDLFEQPLAERTGLDFSRFQAIVPIPYYNIGSDNFWWEQSGLVGQKTQILSWQTGLSTTGAMLTRTSLPQTLRQLQLITEPYRLPALLEDLPNDKPFLLVQDSLRWREFGDHHNHLAAPERLLFSEGELQLYELPISSFSQRIEARVQQVQQQIDGDELRKEGDWLLSDSLQFLYADFSENGANGANEVAKKKEDSKVVNGYRGTGASGDLGAGELLVEWPTAELDTGRYIMSFWVDISPQRHARSEMKLEIFGPKDYYRLDKYRIRKNIRVMDTNGWALVEFPVYLDRPFDRLKLSLEMPLLKGQRFTADDVLLRPATLDVYRKLGDSIYFNNRYYPAR